MDSSPIPRRTSSRDRRKSTQKVIEPVNIPKVPENSKTKPRGTDKKVIEVQKRAPAKRPEREPEDVDDFFEDVANTVENRGPTQQNPSPDLIPVEHIGVVPMGDNGKRMLKYIYNGHTRWVELPVPKYGISLADILPTEVQRVGWMDLVRHPLTWDGIDRKWLMVGPTQLIFEHIPRKVTPNWRTSVESVGMHWFEDYSEHERPPYQMSLLFRVAILGSPYQTLGSYDIVEILMAKFPWYNANRYRERTSSSQVQRSRDLNAYWVDQISNMSSKSTNRTWLDRHPFLARMTRGAKGHFWRLKDVPVYRIPAGKLPVYAVLSLPPGTVVRPSAAAAHREITEEEKPRVWDRDSYSPPPIAQSMEMFPIEDTLDQPASMKPYISSAGKHSLTKIFPEIVVEQNSSGEEEVPSEEEEEEEDTRPRKDIPVYPWFRGMVPKPPFSLHHAPKLLQAPEHTTIFPPPPQITSIAQPQATPELPMMPVVPTTNGHLPHQQTAVTKAQREDVLMELVEFALEMDTRLPKRQDDNRLVRCSSDTGTGSSSASRTMEGRPLKRILSATNVSQLASKTNEEGAMTASMKSMNIGF